jgi:hypothetical protein
MNVCLELAERCVNRTRKMMCEENMQNDVCLEHAE